MATEQRRDKILKTGYLFKQGGSYRNWNRRYFVLRKSTLNYYENEGDKTPKGIIDLTKGRGVRSREHCQLDGEEWPRLATKTVAFGLAVENRTFYLFGYDEAAVDDWKSVLEESIQQVGNPDSNYKEDVSVKPERMSSKLIHGGGRLVSRASKHFRKSSVSPTEELEKDDKSSLNVTPACEISPQSATVVEAN